LKPFDVDWVERQLADGSLLGRPLHHALETTSTNDDAKLAAREGTAEGTTFVADVQTRGRGRRGRSWESAPGDALLLSIVLRPQTKVLPTALTLSLGLGVHQALQPLVSEPLSVKWPNDVLCGRKKLCGILVETEIVQTGFSPIVAGIGVNVHTSQFPPELHSIATSLKLLGASVEREQVLVDVLVALSNEYRSFREQGMSSVLERLRRVDALRGQRIRVDDTLGTGAGIDDTGQLLVRRDDGVIVPILAGTVEWA
jgi:BirA family biotin operon repressor/biotin-[acetyl-CoA-carboxylase] ligase